jgi:putative MFS transporter
MSEQVLVASGGDVRHQLGDRLDTLPVVRTHRTIMMVVGVGLFFDFFDSNLSGTIAKVLQAGFSFDTNALKLVLASAFVGQFVGAIVLGGLADRIGRRRAFMVNLAIYSLFTLAGAFSPNAAWLIVTRFLAGLGIGAETALSDCYLSELLPAGRRGRYIALAYTVGFCAVPVVGFAALLLAPRTVLGVAGWRLLFVLGAIGAAVVWVLRRKLIESPRWLAARGRLDEAEKLVRGLEAEAGRHGVLSRQGDSVPQPRARLRTVLRPPYLRRTVMLWVFSVLSASAYYGFGTLAPQVLAHKGLGVVLSLGYVAVSFVGYPIGSLLSVPLMDRMERRSLLVGSAAAMALCGLGFASARAGFALVAFGLGYTLLSNIFANVSHVYVAEQYPTEIRTTATGIAYSLSRLAAAALPFVLLPILQAHGPSWLFLVVAAGVAVLVLDVLLLGDRTTGTSVERPLSLPRKEHADAR